jgi:hypothetical protein
MKLKENKAVLSEGLLNKIVDNFFKALQKGVSDSYIAAADKAGMHPTAIKAMKNIEDQYGDLLKQIRQNHNA